jgi:hypothetical protein
LEALANVGGEKSAEFEMTEHEEGSYDCLGEPVIADDRRSAKSGQRNDDDKLRARIEAATS